MFIDSEEVCGNTMIDTYQAQEYVEQAYNNAIDDFVKLVHKHDWNIRNINENSFIYGAIDTLAEQLKAGGKEVAEEYKGGWIPCSERLPEESGYYLVTYHDWSDGNFLPKYDDTYVRRLHYQISDHFVGWNYPKNVDDRAENDCHKEVIAWQPLPEPFKERD